MFARKNTVPAHAMRQRSRSLTHSTPKHATSARSGDPGYGLSKGSTSEFGMAVSKDESSNELARNSKLHRNSMWGPFLFLDLCPLTRGKGLRSKWQSRQSDRGEMEPSRRSSELSGALHSSQRGGPTRPLWSCAIEIPRGRRQTGEQMRQQMLCGQAGLVLRCFINDFVWTHFGNLIILRWSEDHGVQRSAPDGRVFPPKQ